MNYIPVNITTTAEILCYVTVEKKENLLKRYRLFGAPRYTLLLMNNDSWKQNYNL